MIGTVLDPEDAVLNKTKIPALLGLTSIISSIIKEGNKQNEIMTN